MTTPSLRGSKKRTTTRQWQLHGDAPRARRHHPMVESLETRILMASQAYNWQNAPFGGGGFVTGIVFSPTVPNLIYARTDVGGAYRWDQGIGRWTPLTDWVAYNDPAAGGGVGNEALAIDPSDSNRVYTTLGLYTASWGGNAAVLRSTDRGQTWLRTDVPFKMGGNEDGRSNGERLMVDPNSDNILLLATPDNGLWKSADYGATWNQLTSFPVTTTPDGAGVNFVQFIKSSGTAGSATPTIYVGVSQTVNNLYRSTDGGATWQNISNPSLDPTHMPARSAQDGKGNMYITYGVAPGPNGVDIPSGARAGSVWKLAMATNTWTDVTPNTNGQGGFSGVSVDAQHPGTVVISTMDRWWPNDDVYRSTNGGSTWTSLRNTDITPWAWTDKIQWDGGKGNFNWAGDLEIDPFNSDHALVTTGGGINSTFDLTAADTGAATHWNTFVNGMEETAQLALVSPPSGAPLITAAGDLGGSRFADLTIPPSKYSVLPETSRDIDFAESNPNLLVRSGDPSPNIVYSRDNAVTWTAFPSLPANTGTVTGSMDNAGMLAMSADGNTVVWDPGDDSSNNLKFPLSYSTWKGSAWGSWTTSTWSGSANVKPVSDCLNANDFYILDGTKLYLSTDRGASWTLQSSSAPSGTLEASFVASGDLWVSAYGNGLWHSTNYGATWTHVASSAVTYAAAVTLGKAATGQSYPAIYVTGSANGTTGMFRSDDGGTTWLTISDSQHQYIGAIVGDRNIYGRVYVGAGGRGIIYGDIQSTAPSVATAAAATAVTGNTTTSNLSVLGADDGGEPSLTYTWRVTNKPPGSTVPTFSVNGTNGAKNTTATFSSSGYYSFQVAMTDAQGHIIVSSVGLSVSVPVGIFTSDLDIGSPNPSGSGAYNASTATYTVAGSGSDIWNTSDQFHFDSQSFTDGGSIVARVTGVQKTDPWAKAGVMFRDSTAASAMFADVVVTPSSGVSFQWRNSTGGNPSYVQTSGITAPAWVKLVRTGNSFTAFYATTTGTPTSADWKQIGTAQTIAMDTSVQVGLAVTSHSSGSLNSATFTNVQMIQSNAAPTVATVATATPNPVTATSAALSVLGADDGGESNLTYTWATTGTPPAAVSFSSNGTNAAKSTTATFTKSGTYNFRVAITDASGLTATSSVSLNVSLGAFTDSADIGSPATAGSLSYNSSTGAYTIKGGGADVWGTSDQFRYSYATLSGSGQIITRVTSITNTDTNAKAGVMFRNSTAANSAFANLSISPAGMVKFEARSSAGANAVFYAQVATSLPVYLKLVRSGTSNNLFAAYYSTNGTSWTQLGTTKTIVMASTVLAGLGVTSHNNTAGVLNTAVLDHVQLATGTGPTLVSAVSRKKQGATGTYDLALSLNPSTPSIEPRYVGANQLIFTFSEPISASDGVLSSNEFTISNASFSSASISGSTLTLNLASVADAARMTVAISGLINTSGYMLSGASGVTVRNLCGDVDQNGTVNSTDVGKLQAASGLSTNLTNYLLDLNESGAINSTDIALCKTQSGKTVS